MASPRRSARLHPILPLLPADLIVKVAGAARKGVTALMLLRMEQTCRDWLAALRGAEELLWERAALERFGERLRSMLAAVPRPVSFRTIYRLQLPAKPKFGSLSDYVFTVSFAKVRKLLAAPKKKRPGKRHLRSVFPVPFLPWTPLVF